MESVSVHVWDGRGGMRVGDNAVLFCHGRPQTIRRTSFFLMTVIPLRLSLEETGLLRLEASHRVYTFQK